jgi:hypothetical protein
MNAFIAELLTTIDEHARIAKDTKSKLKELVESSDIYKTVYESSVSTHDENGFEVSEKDAAKHAYAVTLKNFRKLMKKEDE